MVGPEVMQMFPLDYGARSFVEDVLGQDLHPMTADNVFAGPGMGLPPAPMMGPASPVPQMGGGAQAAPGLGLNAMPVPGDEPGTNQMGGLPLPGPQTVGGLNPPSGTRP
jgi:hypothetical protein